MYLQKPFLLISFYLHLFLFLPLIFLPFIFFFIIVFTVLSHFICLIQITHRHTYIQTHKAYSTYTKHIQHIFQNIYKYIQHKTYTHIYTQQIYKAIYTNIIYIHTTYTHIYMYAVNRRSSVGLTPGRRSIYIRGVYIYI